MISLVETSQFFSQKELLLQIYTNLDRSEKKKPLFQHRPPPPFVPILDLIPWIHYVSYCWGRFLDELIFCLESK